LLVETVWPQGQAAGSALNILDLERWRFEPNQEPADVDVFGQPKVRRHTEQRVMGNLASIIRSDCSTSKNVNEEAKVKAYTGTL
jgi:hypothetical protein